MADIEQLQAIRQTMERLRYDALMRQGSVNLADVYTASIKRLVAEIDAARTADGEIS